MYNMYKIKHWALALAIMCALSGLVPAEVAAGKREFHFVHAHMNAYSRDVDIFSELQFINIIGGGSPVGIVQT